MRRTGLVILSLVVSLTGCASFVKTEGSSGPIAWRVTDLGTSPRSVEGQATESYVFNLIIKNVSDRTIAFSRMERTVYQAGGGEAGRRTLEGRWELRPGVERRFQLGSYSSCRDARGCEDRGGAQPLWRIAFFGVDDQNRPVESRFEIMLPPRTAPKYVQLSPAGLRGRSGDTSPEGAKTPEPPIVQVVARAAASSLRVDAPSWRGGDEWEYRWQTPAARGVFVWTVDREETIDGIPAYVIKTDRTREIFYRKADMAAMRETVEGRIVIVNSPPRLKYVWPLEVGKTWEQAIHEERPAENRADDRVDVVSVEAEETVTVPAGTFRAVKLVCRNKATQAIRYEEWYAPELKHPVLLRERLTSGELRVRELTSYTVR